MHGLASLSTDWGSPPPLEVLELARICKLYKDKNEANTLEITFRPEAPVHYVGEGFSVKDPTFRAKGEIERGQLVKTNKDGTVSAVNPPLLLDEPARKMPRLPPAEHAKDNRNGWGPEPARPSMQVHICPDDARECPICGRSPPKVPEVKAPDIVTGEPGKGV